MSSFSRVGRPGEKPIESLGGGLGCQRSVVKEINAYGEQLVFSGAKKIWGSLGKVGVSALLGLHLGQRDAALTLVFAAAIFI